MTEAAITGEIEEGRGNTLSAGRICSSEYEPIALPECVTISPTFVPVIRGPTAITSPTASTPAKEKQKSFNKCCMRKCFGTLACQEGMLNLTAQKTQAPKLTQIKYRK